MKVVLTQLNIGSKFRFMPSGVSSSLSNYPRDGWLTEAAARKWAKANGHEIVKVEKVAGNGEKIHRIEYTYKDRFGKTKKQTSELVGNDVEPLKKRIVEGLTRNGDTLVSFGKITTKDSAEDSLVQRIADKYAMDADEKFFFEVLSRNGRVISRIKAPETISKAIAFRLADQESAKFKKPWAKCRIVDSKGKTFETYNRNFKTNEFVFKNIDASDDSSIVSRIAQKYALDAIGAGVVVPSFKAKTEVFNRLAVGNDPNAFNKAKKGLLDIVETIKKEIERQKSRNIPQKQKDEILKRLNKELEETKKSIELYKKGRQTQPQTTKQWNRAMLRKDSADEADAAFGVKIPDDEKGTERTTMEKVFKELYLANAWKKVKKGNTIVIRTNINGKDQDVAIIQYFNPNTVSITPRKGAPSMVSLKNASVMAAKMGVEGRRSYNDSADDFASDASVATFTVKSNRNGSKYGYIEKICKTEAEAKALVDKLKKDGFVAMYRKVMYRDSSDAMDRIRAKYCMDGQGYNFYDLKTALANGDIKPNQRMVSSVGGGMAKTAKEWLDMGVKVVNANKPYPLDKMKKR